MIQHRIPGGWVACAVLLLVYTGCGRDTASDDSGETPAAAEQKVVFAVVTAGELRNTVEVPCTVVGYEQAALMARVEGYVSQVAVNIGDEVREGQLLAKLDVPELHAEVERRRQMVVKAGTDIASREAELEQAKAGVAEQEALVSLRQSELTRITNLVQGGALKQQRIDEATFASESAKASLERSHADIETAVAHVEGAQAQLGVTRAELQMSEVMAAYTSIQAPFDGLITDRMADPGAFVKPAGGADAVPLFEIAHIEKVRAILFLPMENTAELDDGDEAIIHGIAGLSSETIPGTITRHAKAFHSGSRMMRAEIDLDNPIDETTGKRKLKPGDYGKVTLTLRKYSDIPTVPATAVVQQNGSSYVMVIDESNRCYLRTVKVAITRDSIVGLADGVKIGERVVAGDIGRFEHEQQLAADSLEPFEATSH